MRKLLFPIAALAALAGTAVLGPFALKIARNAPHLGRSLNCRRLAKEAPAALARLHAAETRFRRAHGAYTSDLSALGLAPDPSAFYLYGFASGAGAHHSAHPGMTGGRAGKLGGLEIGVHDLPADARAWEDGFLAAAVSDVRPGAALDVWTIDHAGHVVHRQDGCWD